MTQAQLFVNEEQPLVLGDKYTDTITGFCGTVVARHEYLGGWVRYTLEAKVGSAPAPTEATFDASRLRRTFPLQRDVSEPVGSVSS